MVDPQRVVIVGAGLAGASAAAAIREQGYTGPVTLFGKQSHRPYELPALSKAVLVGESDEPDWVHEDGFYAAQDIDYRPGIEITAIRPADRVVVDDSGSEHGYDRLLLATGSRPRLLDVPGAGLAGLHTLRTLDDALALRAEFTEGRRVVIVGGGWIGCEAAAAARQRGAQVTVVEPLALPLLRVLGDQVATVFRDLHVAHGVTWLLGTGVEGFESDGARVEKVRCADGTELPADVVLVAVGAAPDVLLAQQAGADMVPAPVGGVAVDAALRTSVPDVFAAGDVAAHDHPRYGERVRVEHWANAKEQGVHVAGNMLGGDAPYQASPYFFSDQYDLGMEYRGLADPQRDEVVVRGDLGAREFIAYWLRDGRVRAAMNVNSWDHGDALQALVDEQATVATEELPSP